MFASPTAMTAAAEHLAPDCHGQNFFALDRGLQSLLTFYMEPDLRSHLWPHYDRLGALAGNQLDIWSRQVDRHGPVLHSRDRQGRDEETIEFHPAWHAMGQVAYGDFGLHCMGHKAGVLGWPAPIPPVAKYAFHYIFTQAEYGLMCPVSMTDTTALLIERYAPEEVRAHFLPRLHSQDMALLYRGAQFMTEKSGGSDMEHFEMRARLQEGRWRLYGEKWYCSAPDADIAMVLARPEGAVAGTAGLALFALPRRLPDGSRNAWRIVRLKSKLGTRSLATGEVLCDGALAYPMGEVGPGRNAGLRQALDQLNVARLSLSVRAAALLRRSWNEAHAAACGRHAFGQTVIEKPLMRRQLMKILVPAEQALSITLHAAGLLGRAQAGDTTAEALVRILTPLAKFRASRDSVKAATAALEVRGGNGFTEDWVNSRLVRDTITGVIVEGTSSLNALDIVQRVAGKAQLQHRLAGHLRQELSAAAAMPDSLVAELTGGLDQAVGFVDAVAAAGCEAMARKAASALYHATTAVLMACEGAQLGERGQDARRLLLARMVLRHRLHAAAPLTIEPSEKLQIAALLSEAAVPLDRARALLAAS